MSVKKKAIDAFERIGRHNGTALAASQDPMDAVLHEYHIATLGESYFKKRREVAKKDVEKRLSSEQADRLLKTVAEVKKQGVGDKVKLVSASTYELDVTLRNGAERLDTAKLKSNLMKDHKLTAEQVAKLMEDSMTRSDPAQSWGVVEK